MFRFVIRQTMTQLRRYTSKNDPAAHKESGDHWRQLSDGKWGPPPVGQTSFPQLKTPLGKRERALEEAYFRRQEQERMKRIYDKCFGGP